VHWRGLEELVRLARQLVPLAFFLANREQADARALAAKRNTGVRGAHHGELDKMLRPAFHRRPGIEENGRLLPGGNESSEGWTIDARQAAKGANGSHHGATGVTGAEEGSGATFADRLGGELDRGARLSPQRGGGLLRHADVFGGVKDLDVEGAGTRMPSQLPLDQLGVTDQQESDLQMPRRNERAVDDAARGVVAAHGVNGYTHSEAISSQLSAIRLIADG
jgi:hypothetical protein